MKRTLLVFIIAGLVLATVALWFFSSKNQFKLYDLFQFGIILLVVGFALFVGYRRFTSARRGEPAEDELSKKVMQKAAAWSYYISIYLWLAIMYVSDKVNLPTHTLVGEGIVGMALILVVCWVVINFRGIRND